MQGRRMFRMEINRKVKGKGEEEVNMIEILPVHL
jgi:hypothetical protein